MQIKRSRKVPLDGSNASWSQMVRRMAMVTIPCPQIMMASQLNKSAYLAKGWSTFCADLEDFCSFINRLYCCCFREAMDTAALYMGYGTKQAEHCADHFHLASSHSTVPSQMQRRGAARRGQTKRIKHDIMQNSRKIHLRAGLLDHCTVHKSGMGLQRI